MRIPFMLFAVLIALSGIAGAAGKKADQPVQVLRKELEGKIVPKNGTPVKVQSDGCSMAIEFVDQKVTFQFPLKGTQVIEENNSLLVVNSNMTRKFVTRERESFTRLILHVGSHALDHIKSLFQQAIQSCAK